MKNNVLSFLGFKKNINKPKSGFTIVELLVVIVVIGILAAITVVSYTGISSQANATSLQSDLANASQQLKLFQVENNNYPTTISSDCVAQPDTTTNKCLKSSLGTTYQYAVNNNISPQTFYLYATKNNIKYRLANDSNPVASSPVVATGGTVADIGGFRIHTFNSGGTFTLTSGDNVEVLVVAGGGGGGTDRAGAGGAGGLIYKPVFAVSSQAYAITVGAGGAGSAANVIGVNGGNSIFGSLVAVGGGGGGTGNGALGSAGGSGGGGGNSGVVNPCAGGLATPGQGNNGGMGVYTAPNYGAGGGGGAGGPGVAGTSTSSGNGGAGLAYSVSGSSVYYAGGGGAGSYAGGINGIGGIGGGGNGGVASATPGTPNTGGGGGSSGNTITSGGSGGSGIVIIRYPL